MCTSVQHTLGYQSMVANFSLLCPTGLVAKRGRISFIKETTHARVDGSSEQSQLVPLIAVEPRSKTRNIQPDYRRCVKFPTVGSDPFNRCAYRIFLGHTSFSFALRFPYVVFWLFRPRARKLSAPDGHRENGFTAVERIPYCQAHPTYSCVHRRNRLPFRPQYT